MFADCVNFELLCEKHANEKRGSPKRLFAYQHNARFAGCDVTTLLAAGVQSTKGVICRKTGTTKALRRPVRRRCRGR